MEEKLLKFLEGKLPEVIDNVMESKLAGVVGPIVAAETRSIVEKMRIERSIFGSDRTGLTEKTKKDFVEVVKAALTPGMQIDTKANEALIIETDNRGGYLVSKEIANAILRIAASVGLIMSQATKWPMGTDEKGIPTYTGAFLEGEYLGVDAAGGVTGLTFGQANLVVKKWQLAFVVGNDLLSDSSVELADWLLALGGESLANMIDKQGFAGNGNPFVGILENTDVTTLDLPSGEDTFAEYRVIDDSSDVIAAVEESVLEGSAFYMHRSVWAKLRVQKDGTYYILPQAGAASNGVLSNNPTGGGVKIAGEILGYPVFTSRHLPAITASGASKKFIVFGNMKAMAYGDKGELRVEKFTSGAFGGKEIALADQQGIVYKHRHALVVALPAAFVAVKTAA